MTPRQLIGLLVWTLISGGYCYDGRYLCSETCERSYLAYLKGGVL